MTKALPSATASQKTLPMSRWAGSRGAKSLYLLGRLLDKASFGRVRLQIYLFCAQPIGGRLFDSLRDDPATVVNVVQSGSPLIANFPRPPEINRQRFARGATCYAVTVNGAFAGHIWLASDHYDEDEVRCRYTLPTDRQSVWDYDVYVEPSYRLGRTLGRLWKGVDAVLGAKGVRWSVSRISLFNAASVQAHERMGAIHLATGVFLVLGAMQVSIFSKAPYMHVGLKAVQRPVIALEPPASAISS